MDGHLSMTRVDAIRVMLPIETFCAIASPPTLVVGEELKVAGYDGFGFFASRRLLPFTNATFWFGERPLVGGSSHS